MSSGRLRSAFGLGCLIALLAVPVACGGDSNEEADRPATTSENFQSNGGNDEPENGNDGPENGNGGSGGDTPEDGDDDDDGPSTTSSVELSPTFAAHLINFRDVKVGASKTVGLQVSASEDYVLAGLEVRGDHPEDFAFDPGSCTAGVRLSEQSCTLEITFAPLRPGTRRASLRFLLGPDGEMGATIFGRGVPRILTDGPKLTEPDADITTEP